MDSTTPLDFIRSEGVGVGIIGVAVFGLALLIVGVSQWLNGPPITYTAVANLIVATVASASLYIAWRELVRKTQPNITVGYDFEPLEDDSTREQMQMEVVNSGENVLTPTTVEYGLVKKDGEQFYFTNWELGEFDDSGLQPGEVAQLDIGTDVVLFQLIRVHLLDWKGDGTTISDVSNDRVNRMWMYSEGRGNDIKIQKLFDAVLNVQHQLGSSIPIEDLQSSSVEELIEEHGLTPGISVGRVADGDDETEVQEEGAGVESE